MEQEHLYSIGDISTLCDLSVKTLHYYDQIGLVKPSSRGEYSRYRYYTEKQIYQLFKIKKLKLLGFSLAEIADLVQSDDTSRLVQGIDQRLQAINQDILEMQNTYLEGVCFLNRLKEGQNLFCRMDETLNNPFWKETLETVQLVNIPEVNSVFTREKLPNYRNENVNIARWAQVLKLAEQCHVVPTGPIRITYHQPALSQFFLECCDYEIHVEVDRMTSSPNVQKFGGFKAAITYHVGGYRSIINAHLRALQWIYANRYRVSGNITEEFMISPLDVMEPEKYLTKIIIPVEEGTGEFPETLPELTGVLDRQGEAG